MRNKKEIVKISESIIIFILVLTLAFILLFTFTDIMHIAFADEGEYLKADCSSLKNNEYASKSSLKVSMGEDVSFYIPESYFVKVGSLAFGTTYNATYMGENVYVTIENPALTSVSAESSIYPDITLTIKEGESVIIDGTTLDSTYSIKLMGYGEDSKLYVKATKEETKLLGFVDALKLNSFNVPYEVSSQNERNAILEAERFNPNNELSGSRSKGIRIAIIVCLAVAIVALTILLFVGPKNTRHVKLKNDNDVDYDKTR